MCRTRCSIEEMPAGFVAIMLKLLTYVCVLVILLANYDSSSCCSIRSSCCLSYACNVLRMELPYRFPVCRCYYDIKSSRQEYIFSVLTSRTYRCKQKGAEGDFRTRFCICFSHTCSLVHTDERSLPLRFQYFRRR